MNNPHIIFDVIKSGDYVVLDTETTGIDRGSEIVSIAVIASDARPLLNTLVHPTKPIPAEATKIHGITNEAVKNVLPFPAELLQELLTGRNVIVYNANYDIGMLYNSTRLAGFTQIEWRNIATWHCAMETFAEIYGDWNDYHQSYRWQKLVTAASYYGVPTDGAHGALADCLMTLQVCKKMAEKHPFEKARLK
jgi:DNA polymerase-3 subunit epsilon